MKGKHNAIPKENRDHEHTCWKCKRVWKCKWFTRAKCKATGVFQAVKVNGEGPWCHICRRKEIRERIRALREAAD